MLPVSECSVCQRLLERVLSFDSYPLLTSACRADIVVPMLPLVVGICRFCSHVQLMKQPTPEQLDFIYNGDYTSVVEKGTYDSNDMLLLEAKMFLDFANSGPLKTGARILEIGCFDGAFLSLLGKGYDLLGAEPNPMGRVASERYGVQIVPKYFSADDFETESLDLVIMRHLIEHIPNPQEILKECKQVLKPDGRLFIETPWIEHTLRGNVIGNFYHQHLHYFSRESLSILLQSVGFHIIAHGIKDFRQFVVAEPSEISKTPEAPAAYAETVHSLFHAYRSFSQDLSLALQDWLNFSNETLAVYGASSTATGIIHLMAGAMDRVSYVVDGDPRKRDMVLPATEAIVREPDYLLKMPVGAVLIASDLFKNEILATIQNRYGNVVKHCLVVHPLFEVIPV